MDTSFLLNVLASLTGTLISKCSSLTASLISRYWAVVALWPTTTRSLYLHQLIEKIREMPFIYKDLEAEVINDFVDVEFQNLEIGNLRLMAASDRLNLDDYERLRRYNHVLFLGNAGIGKTTFQRRAIITLATKRKDAQFVWDGEVRLPIYVPLKAIDNSAPYPILNYILRYNPLFSQAGGLEKLIDLASHRKLSLFLDGYDEIPFTGGGSNFVQIELGLILFPASIEESVVKNTTFKEFYEALPETRVWLSSRREFFEQNPIPCPTAKSMNPTRLTAVELIGIGNNRIKLAKNIFDKYRRRAKKYEEILSEEYFLFDIESSNDNELKRLSYNPLFLTVMCYIYAQKAIDANSFKVTWANNFEGLVFECINLLLNDLDEIKARDLPAAHRAALLTRRNAFLEEKQLFLQYFACQLFFEGKSIFTLDDLKAKIKSFFKEENYCQKSDYILDELDSDKPSQPNFALQLIYCGIFVIVDKSKNEILYDFPHQRFRELLASKYVANPDRYEHLLANIEQKQFSEFLQVFFASSGFKETAFQDEALMSILEKAKASVDDRYVKITQNFLAKKPENYDPNKIIRRFLLQSLSYKDVSFQISLDILGSYRPNAEFLERLSAVFRDSITEAAPKRLSLACALLKYYNNPLLQELLRNNLTQLIDNRAIFPTLLQYACSVNLALVVNLADNSISAAAFSDICYSVSWYICRISEKQLAADSSFLAQLSTKLESTRKIEFLYFVYLYAPAKYSVIEKILGEDIKTELYNFAKLHRRKIRLPKNPGEVCNIVTNDTIQKFVLSMKVHELPVGLTRKFPVKSPEGVIRQVQAYLVFRSLSSLSTDIERRLRGLRYKLMSPTKFSQRLDDIFLTAIKTLTKQHPYEFPFGVIKAHDLVPKHEYIDSEEFINQLKMYVDSEWKLDKVSRVQDVVNRFNYVPPLFVELFS